MSGIQPSPSLTSLALLYKPIDAVILRLFNVLRQFARPAARVSKLAGGIPQAYSVRLTLFKYVV